MPLAGNEIISKTFVPNSISDGGNVILTIVVGIRDTGSVEFLDPLPSNIIYTGIGDVLPTGWVKIHPSIGFNGNIGASFSGSPPIPNPPTEFYTFSFGVTNSAGMLNPTCALPSPDAFTNHSDDMTFPLGNLGAPFQFNPCLIVTAFVPPPSKKKRSGMGAFVRCPDEIIFKADTQYPQVKYCNTTYNFYGSDEQGLRYINSRSNISQRNTRTWWVFTIQKINQ